MMIKRIKEIILSKAKSPISRIGLLLLILSAFTWTFTAIHWNFTEKPFIYFKNENIRIQNQVRPIAKSGTHWKEDILDKGWVLYDEKCIETKKKETKSSFSAIIPSEKCQIKFLPFKYEKTSSMKISIPRYLKELFDAKRGQYFKYNFFSLSIFILGLLMYFGLIEKVFNWIKTGK